MLSGWILICMASTPPGACELFTAATWYEVAGKQSSAHTHAIKAAEGRL
jgi:hypothetical protein